MRSIVLIIAIPMMAVVVPASASNVVSSVPEKPDTNAQYVLHIHGSAVDKGKSDYIKSYRRKVRKLSENGFVVISEERPRGMISKFPDDHERYARKIADQVSSLLAAGVPATNIAVTGVSRGALIAQIASGLITNPNVKYGVISGCISANGAYKKAVAYINSNYAPKLTGQFLTVRDKDDPDFGSCVSYFEKASAQPKYREVVISTGKGHEAFKEPLDAWMKPLVEWLARKSR